MDVIKKIQKWYKEHCDGYWEHHYGVKIDTLDNPGWTIRIDLIGTKLENSFFEFIDIDRQGDDNWVRCRIDNKFFEGDGGPENLEEMLEIFLNWSESADDMV